jgi:dTDP-4-dehydrorhamnose 3,5-epimerase
MKFIKTSLDGVLIIEPFVHGDKRGWFIETWSNRELKEAGITADFVQDNHSFSAKAGTLRGLHFQNDPKAQAKLVRCTRGAVLDVAADIRKGSPNYLKWVAVTLSEENKRQIFIPKGFAHGFLTLTDNAEVQYKADEYYSPECDRSIKYDDPDIGIVWGTDSPILSQRDSQVKALKDSDCNFVF